MIYRVEISDGYIGTELYYLCHENDYLDHLCYTDYIVQEFLGYMGVDYPTIEELMEDGLSEEEADEELNSIVTDNIEYVKTPATREDINSLDLIPDSCIDIDSDDFILYKSQLSRDVEIDRILSK